MFKHKKEEFRDLISKKSTSSWGGRRKLPRAFTEQGIYMLMTVLKHGIIERENYNKPKSENSRQPGTTPEKENAITEALKFFKMI